jgi:hypothetical protein
MKFSIIINEVTLMQPASASCTKLWSKILRLGKAHPSEDGKFLTFEKFYDSFMRKHEKQPTLEDALAFIRTNWG